MSNSFTLEGDTPVRPAGQSTEDAESFGDLLSQFEQSHSNRPASGGGGVDATVIAVSGDSVFLDIGYKTEVILPLAAFTAVGETAKAGDKVRASRYQSGGHGLAQVELVTRKL